MCRSKSQFPSQLWSSNRPNHLRGTLIGRTFVWKLGAFPQLPAGEDHRLRSSKTADKERQPFGQGTRKGGTSCPYECRALRRIRSHRTCRFLHKTVDEGSRIALELQVGCIALRLGFPIVLFNSITSFSFTDENLCSHVWAVCYLAETLFNEASYEAEPCTRKCPAGPVIGGLRRGRDYNRYAVGNLIPMGHRTPN